MTTNYMEFLSAHYPATTGMLDTNSRAVAFCNFDVRVVGSPADLEGDVATIIHAAGFGTLAESGPDSGDMYLGPTAVIPPGAGPYVTVIQTHGFVTDFTQQDDRFERPSFQVAVRAKDEKAAMDRVLAIFRLLDGMRHRAV